jgi:hypothetical protein
VVEPTKAVPSSSRTAKSASKPAVRRRRPSVKKKAVVGEVPAVDQTRAGGPGPGGRWESARQADKLVILGLALLFGLIGEAVRVLWLASIVLMAILFGLIAAELRGRRAGGGGVISDVVTTVMTEAKNVAEEISSGTTTRAN